MRQYIGAFLVGLAGWLGYQQITSAEASAPAGQGLLPAPRTFTASNARVIVERLNFSHFSGFFRVADILAVIEIESSFNPRAYRFEAHRGEASYGLMQVLESTARDRGLVGQPEQLFDPETGILYGMRQLKWTYDYLARRLGRQPTIGEWFGAYNAGVGNVLNNGFIPAQYVQKFQTAQGRYV